jgi:hypothetical protein
MPATIIWDVAHTCDPCVLITLDFIDARRGALEAICLMIAHERAIIAGHRALTTHKSPTCATVRMIDGDSIWSTRIPTLWADVCMTVVSFALIEGINGPFGRAVCAYDSEIPLMTHTAARLVCDILFGLVLAAC